MLLRTAVVAALLTLTQSAGAVSQQVADRAREIDAGVVFERLKGLVGTWSTTDRGRSGPEQVTTFKMAGGGRVLVEEMGGTLTNVYHLDVDELMLTHYCGTGNQPRMRVREADDRRVAFEIFDITNLSDPQGYRTTHVDIVFVSADRVELAFRGRSGSEGRETTQVLQLTRRKG